MRQIEPANEMPADQPDDGGTAASHGIRPSGRRQQALQNYPNGKGGDVKNKVAAIIVHDFSIISKRAAKLRPFHLDFGKIRAKNHFGALKTQVARFTS